jgi:hypothetical protein
MGQAQEEGPKERSTTGLNKVSAVEMHRPRVDGPISNHWVSEAEQHTHLELLVGSHTDTKSSSKESYYKYSIDDYPATQCCYCPTSPLAAALDDDPLIDFVVV